MTVRGAASTAVALLGAVAAFQVALAAGAPWGDMSYGGSATTVDGVLPGSYRAMSAVAAVVLLLAAWIVLARAAMVPRGPFGPGFLRGAVWVITGYLALNTVMNLLSSHPGERFGLGAVTLVGAGVCLVVARAPTPAVPARG